MVAMYTITETRIAKVMGMRAKDPARRDRYDAILRKLYARAMTPKVTDLLKHIERVKTWGIFLGSSSGRPTAEVRAIWAEIDGAWNKVNAAFAMLKEQPLIDEVEVVVEGDVTLDAAA